MRTVLFVNEFTEFSYSCYEGIIYWRVLVPNVNNIQASSRLKRSANHLWNNSDVCRKKFSEWSPLRLKFTWNVHRINLHLRFNWDLNLIGVCATQSRWLVINVKTNPDRYRNNSVTYNTKNWIAEIWLDQAFSRWMKKSSRGDCGRAVSTG